MTSLNLKYLHKGFVSTYSHIWGLGLQHRNLAGYNSTHKSWDALCVGRQEWGWWSCGGPSPGTGGLVLDGEWAWGRQDLASEDLGVLGQSLSEARPYQGGYCDSGIRNKCSHQPQDHPEAHWAARMMGCSVSIAASSKDDVVLSINSS